MHVVLRINIEKVRSLFEVCRLQIKMVDLHYDGMKMGCEGGGMSDACVAEYCRESESRHDNGW
jgi:hypothetical protein